MLHIAISKTFCKVIKSLGFLDAVGKALELVSSFRVCLVRCRSGFHRAPTLAGAVADIIASWNIGDSTQVCHLSEPIYDLKRWEQNQRKMGILDNLHSILLLWAGAGPGYIELKTDRNLCQVANRYRIKAPALISAPIHRDYHTQTHTRTQTHIQAADIDEFARALNVHTHAPSQAHRLGIRGHTYT